MPVRARITLVYAVMMALVLAAVSLVVLSRLRAGMFATIDAGLRAQVSELAADVTAEPEQIGSAEGVIDETWPIAQVMDAAGRVLEASPSLGPRALTTKPGFLDAVVETGGEERRARIVASRARGGAIVVVGREVDTTLEALAALSRLLWAAAPLVWLASSAAVWLLAGAALRPVERLRSEAEALSFAGERRRVAVPATRDELARLAVTLNDMLERLEQALDRERRFIDNASHELRTPLAVLRTELELALRRSRTVEELEAAVRSAADEADTLSRLAEHLLVLARADRGMLPAQLARSDLAGLAAQVCEGFGDQAAARRVTIAAAPTGPLWAEADPVLLGQAISNLIDNALRHTGAGGEVRVDVSVVNGRPTIVVADSGTGFDPDVLPRIFEPFVRGDGVAARASGTGLGLAIVRAVAEAHRGSASARNRPGGGAEVELRL